MQEFYILPIVSNEGKLQAAFVRANIGILLDNWIEFKQLKTSDEKLDLLKKLWLLKYQAVLIIESKEIKAIQFKSEKEKSFFLLKNT
jgi:hypothetical protein